MAAFCVRHVFVFVVILQLLFGVVRPVTGKKNDNRNLVEDIIEPKDLKKLLRTKNNVMILFTKNSKESTEIMNVVSEVAELLKGQATLCRVECGGEGKKLCRKLKIAPEPLALKHYKDGEFHKDYDRKLTVQSMVNFLKDPSGDMPWEEDEHAQDIVHIPDASALGKVLHKEKTPIMLMFYAPWCGFCKRLKPEYEAAATELKGHSILAAMDVNKPENSIVRKHFNITGFPTLLYFEGGNLKHKYDGENNKDSIVSFMRNPTKQPEKPKEPEWADTPSDVVHLTDATFISEVQSEPSVLVMFYAPWCGHCKKIKPEYVTAAARLKQQNVPGMLAAVDATKEKAVADQYKINGYPTLKYFKNGELQFDVSLRTADQIEEFMMDPKEPPPPPPPEAPWSEIPSSVVHLNEDDFKVFLKRKKHVLVMFYAPWCGHCKKAKPEFEAAAGYFKDDAKVEFAAVDCTAYSAVCTAHDVKGYPTIKYFSYYKVEKPYEGGRTESEFVEYMKASVDGLPLPSSPPPPPPQEWWKELPHGEHVQYLSQESFDKAVVEQDCALVMFYAPWCGHCKSMKPAFAEAAAKISELKVNCMLGAVDATVENALASKHGIKGFPTLKYFRKGKYIMDYDKKRTVEDIVAFATSPPSLREEL